MKAEENDTNSTFWTQIESVNDELFWAEILNSQLLMMMMMVIMIVITII